MMMKLSVFFYSDEVLIPFTGDDLVTSSGSVLSILCTPSGCIMSVHEPSYTNLLPVSVCYFCLLPNPMGMLY
jgi:hypothetical protein